MKVLLRVLCISLVALSGCQAASSAGRMPGASVSVRRDGNAFAKPQELVLNKAARQKLAAPPVTRAVLVKSLLANKNTKPIIEGAARGAGVEKSELPGLATKPIFAISKSANSAATDVIGYALLDWNKGLTFSLMRVPKFGSSKHHAGDITAQYAEVSSENDLACYWITPKPDDTRLLAFIDLELPTEPATYMVGFRVTDRYGQSPADWVEGAGGPFLKCQGFRLAQSEGSNVWSYDLQMQLIPLQGGAGYGGIISVHPVNGSPFATATMRARNYHFALYVAYPIPDSMTCVLLKDVTVTRL